MDGVVHTIGCGEGMESEFRAALGNLGVFPVPLKFWNKPPKQIQDQCNER